MTQKRKVCDFQSIDLSVVIEHVSQSKGAFQSFQVATSIQGKYTWQLLPPAKVAT